MAIGGRATLRMEPYDPDAVDGDNDGIVQEGTAWERPAGTRLLDSLGRELIRGATSGTRPAGVQVIGRDGTPRSYTPSYGGRFNAPSGVEAPKAPGKPTTLGALGYRSLGEMGLPTVGKLSGRENLGNRVDQILPNLQALTSPKPTPRSVASGPNFPLTQVGRPLENRLTEKVSALVEKEGENLKEIKNALEQQAEKVADGIEEMTPSERKVGTALVTSAVYWATFFKDGGAIGTLLNDFATGTMDADASDVMDALKDFYSIGGVAAIAYTMTAFKEKWSMTQDEITERTEAIREFMDRAGVKAGELSDNIKKFLAEMLKAIKEAISKITSRADRGVGEKSLLPGLGGGGFNLVQTTQLLQL